MPSGMRAELALSEWRRAERELLAADPLSDDASRLAQEVDVLRSQYHAVAGAPASAEPPADVDAARRPSLMAHGRRDELHDRSRWPGRGERAGRRG
jgi:hypothetical protein